jgi:SAM-dependent methyltransferase
MTSRPGEPIRRPESFEDVASDYDAFRLRYPSEVVEDVASAGNLVEGAEVLEIGCGSGQLSVDLARRGCELVAVEMGANLARLARKNLAPFPNARVEVAKFEAWPLPETKFDAVVCATAFHWLDPEVRFAKSAEALHPGGTLVILHVHLVRGGTPGFFSDTQPIYLKWGLSADPFFQPPTANQLPPMYPELELLADYGSVRRHRLLVPRTQATTSYVGLLKTDSLVLTLDPAPRQGFLDDITNLIESKYGGEVSRNFVYEVVAAERV